VRLELRDAAGGTMGAGTGFLIRTTSSNGKDEVYLVTNRHVVQGAPKVVAYFTRSTQPRGPDVGNVFWVDLTLPDGWHAHPDPGVDLCALPLSATFEQLLLLKQERPYFIAPSTNMLATHEDFQSLDAFLPVLFIGYPNGIFDTRNFTPLLRQGFTSSHPALDFCGRTHFIVDGSVFPGSSGSPVLAYDLSIKGQVINYKILGALRAVLYADDFGKLGFADIPTALMPVALFKRFLNLGQVVKSTEVTLLLNDFTAAPLLSAAT